MIIWPTATFPRPTTFDNDNPADSDLFARRSFCAVQTLSRPLFIDPTNHGSPFSTQNYGNASGTPQLKRRQPSRLPGFAS
jgi:hypothetical protein